jgi:hypothetical protein
MEITKNKFNSSAQQAKIKKFLCKIWDIQRTSFLKNILLFASHQKLQRPSCKKIWVSVGLTKNLFVMIAVVLMLSYLW